MIVLDDSKIDKETEGRFLSWFLDRWHCIFKGKEEKQKWFTTKGKINDNSLIKNFLDSEKFIGLGFGNETNYVMLDIDKGSYHHPNHSEGSLQAILDSLESIGLVSYVPLRSSDSTGIHIYFPFPETLNTFSVARAIRVQLEKDGFLIQNGVLEVFPNEKSWGATYNRHRLPLQSGGYLLDDDFFPCSNSISKFCDWMDWASQRQDIELFKEKLTEYRDNKIYSKKKDWKNLKNLPETDVTKKWRKDLETIFIDRGWTGKSQTNDILKAMQTYGKVFLKYSGDKLVDWMVETATTQVIGYKQYCEHQNEIRKRCKEWVQCTESKNYYVPYRDRPDRLKKDENGNLIKPENKNTTKSLNASNRILEAINSITDTIFSTTRDLLLFLQNQTKKLFGLKVSLKTLYKNKSLWEPLINRDTSSTCNITEEEYNNSFIDIPETTSLSNLESVLHLSIYEGVGSDDSPEESQESNLEVFIETENTENVQDLEKVEEIIKLEIENKQVKQENSTKLDNQQKKTKNFSLDCLNLLVYRLKIMDFIGKFREIHDSS